MADKTINLPSSLPAPFAPLPAKGELESPNELFKKMVADNKKQNQRLSANYDQKNLKSSMNIAKDGNKNSPRECKPLSIGLRFIICSLGIAALTMCQMSRMILNLSITSMVDPGVLNQGGDISSDGSCPWPVEDESEHNEEMELAKFEETTTIPPMDGILFYLTTEVSNLESTNSLDLVESDRFMWSMQEQGVLLGGFFYSYFFFMVLGGRMAEIYGSKYIILLAVAGSSLINLSTPSLANYSYTSLVLSRVLMGIIQAGVVPGIYALFSQWLTVTETGIFTSLIKVMFCFGSILASLIFGLFISWKNVFYITGILGGLWSILWVFIATSRPQDNKWISENELKHITKKKRKTLQSNKDLELSEKKAGNSEVEKLEKARNIATPWIEILTNPSVIGFVLVKLSYNYLLDFVTIELPSYLKYVHHASNQTISLIATVTTLLPLLFIALVAWIAQTLIRRRTFNFSKTVWRKIFQGLGSFGIGLGLIVLSLNNCSLLLVAVVLLCISFLCMFTVGGEAVLPYDLSDEYPATIMAIANSVANVSGITTTLLAGWILGDQGGSFDRWNILIRLVGGINILGGLAFTALVKAKPIVFKESAVDAEVPQGEKTSLPEESTEKEKADACTIVGFK